MWVAPKSLAQASFWSSMSTAMTVDAPASRAPAMAASPTPPHPKTATLSPRPTPPVLSAAPRPAMTPQPSRPAAVAGAAGSTFVHWPAATSVFSTNAPMPSAGLSTVPSASVIFWRGVVGGEAVPGLAPPAAAALAAHGSPVEDHEVAGRHVGDVVADGLDQPGRLVAEEEGEVVVDPAFAVVEVGVADAAGLDLDERLARAGVGHEHRLDADRLALRPGHHSPDLMHARRAPRARPAPMPAGRASSHGSPSPARSRPAREGERRRGAPLAPPNTARWATVVSVGCYSAGAGMNQSPELTGIQMDRVEPCQS